MYDCKPILTQKKMNVKPLSFYQSNAEWQVFDRKSVRIACKDFAELIVAFANADGGEAVIGIENDGTITGVDQRMEHLNELLRVPFDFCIPSAVSEVQLVECVDRDGRANHVAVMQIYPDLQLHTTTADEVFYRVGDKSKKLNFDQRLQLMYSKGVRYYETQAVTGSSMQDVDMQKVEEYCAHIGYIRGAELFLRSTAGWLEKKNDEEIPTSATILLFGRHPEDFFPRARVRVIRYEGNTELTGKHLNVTKDVELCGRIGEVFVKSRECISLLLKQRTYLGDDGAFVTEDEYPQVCWEELLINAIGHRDYSILGTDIQVKIFDDHLTVESPGILPGIVKKENMRYSHFSRNPKIMSYLKAYGYVKEFGEGVDRVYNEMAAAGRPEPSYEIIDFMIKVTLGQKHFISTNSTFAPGNTTFAPKLLTFAPENATFAPKLLTFAPVFAELFDKYIANNYVQSKSRTKAANECWKIVEAIHHDGTISTQILAEHTGLSLRSVKNYTKALQLANIIEYVREEGVWKVKIESNMQVSDK